MITLLIIIQCLFGFLGTASALLIGLNFAKVDWDFVTRLDGKQLYLFITATICLAITYGANAAKEILIRKPSIEVLQSHFRKAIQKSTPAIFNSEPKKVFLDALRMIHMSFMRPISLARALNDEVSFTFLLDISLLISLSFISLVLAGLLSTAMIAIGYDADLVIGLRLTIFSIVMAATTGTCLWSLVGRPFGIITLAIS